MPWFLQFNSSSQAGLVTQTENSAVWITGLTNHVFCLHFYTSNSTVHGMVTSKFGYLNTLKEVNDSHSSGRMCGLLSTVATQLLSASSKGCLLHRGWESRTGVWKQGWCRLKCINGQTQTTRHL